MEVGNYSAVELKKKVGQALSMTKVQDQETGRRRELEYQMRKEKGLGQGLVNLM